jgi:hypothetical protein
MKHDTKELVVKFLENYIDYVLETTDGCDGGWQGKIREARKLVALVLDEPTVMER